MDAIPQEFVFIDGLTSAEQRPEGGDERAAASEAL